MENSTILNVLENATCIYSFDEINQALDNMAKAITEQLHTAHPIILGVMTGALVPMGHLLTRLHFPLEIDYLHVTRYRGSLKGRDLHWLVEPRLSLHGRVVLVIDDIMDGGLTLAAIVDYCKQAGVRAVYTAVMVSKKRVREPGVNFEPDFVGVYTEDHYLFGFGLDYKECWRNVPGIYQVNSMIE